MVTSLNNTVVAHDDGAYQVTYKRFLATFSDTGISTGIQRATVPQGAIIIGTDVYLEASFNANSTNVFTVGSNSTPYNNLVADGDVTEGTVGLYQNIKPTGAALGPLSADTQFFAKYTQTGGTAATSGRAHVVIKYVMLDSNPVT